MVASIAAFLGVAAVVIVTPGQDTALTIRNTLRGGRRSGMLTAAGVAAGQATWTFAAALGIAALLRASEPAFLAVKLAGAAYLVVLGMETMINVIRGRHATARPSRSARARGSFRQGLLSNLGNPKMALFFTSLLPQFGHTSLAALLTLGFVFCAMTLTWLCCYSIAVARAGDFLRRRRTRAVLDSITGATLVAFGLRLATD